jgi:hypothetical protein
MTAEASQQGPKKIDITEHTMTVEEVCAKYGTTLDLTKLAQSQVRKTFFFL